MVSNRLVIMKLFCGGVASLHYFFISVLFFVLVASLRFALFIVFGRKQCLISTQLSLSLQRDLNAFGISIFCFSNRIEFTFFFFFLFLFSFFFFFLFGSFSFFFFFLLFFSFFFVSRFVF